MWIRKPVLPHCQMQLEHGNPQYCFECSEYPCKKYDDIDVFDSFITHRNQKRDLEKAQQDIDSYNAEQIQKRQILERLLKDYNDGRKKTLFCLAVNLMSISDLLDVFVDSDMDLPVKERAQLMEKRLKEKSSVELKLRKKK